MFGVGIAVAILREIEALPREECIFAENQAKHPNHFGRLHIGNAVDQFLGVVEPFTDDAPRIARILDRQWPQKRVPDALYLVEPDENRVEDIGHELALNIDGVSFIEPHIKWCFHRGFAAALIVFELMNDDRVSIQERRIESMFGDD